MCNFLSAIVMKDGSLRMHPRLDSHSAIAAHFDLKDGDNPYQSNYPYAKVELRPSDTPFDVATWEFQLDERTVPSWWEDVQNGVEEDLRARADKMIVRDTTSYRRLEEGTWLIAPEANVYEVGMGARVVVCAGRIHAVEEDVLIERLAEGGEIRVLNGRVTECAGTVHRLYSSRAKIDRVTSTGVVECMDDGEIDCMEGTLRLHSGGVVRSLNGGTIERMDGYAVVREADGGTIKQMAALSLAVVRDGVKVTNVAPTARLGSRYKLVEAYFEGCDESALASLRKVQAEREFSSTATV